MDNCRYVHWALEDPGPRGEEDARMEATRDADRVDEVRLGPRGNEKAVQKKRADCLGTVCQPRPLPPQWINADLRVLDVATLGKFHVVVADPPWAIHQEVRSTVPAKW